LSATQPLGHLTVKRFFMIDSARVERPIRGGVIYTTGRLNAMPVLSQCELPGQGVKNWFSSTGFGVLKGLAGVPR